MPVHHQKGQPDPSSYVREKGCFTLSTNRETPCRTRVSLNLWSIIGGARSLRKWPFLEIAIKLEPGLLQKYNWCLSIQQANFYKGLISKKVSNQNIPIF